MYSVSSFTGLLGPEKLLKEIILQDLSSYSVPVVMEWTNKATNNHSIIRGSLTKTIKISSPFFQ